MNMKASGDIAKAYLGIYRRFYEGVINNEQLHREVKELEAEISFRKVKPVLRALPRDGKAASAGEEPDRGYPENWDDNF